MNTCPTCDSPIGKTRSFIAEKLLAKVPKPCKFAADGCKQEMLEVSFRLSTAACPFLLKLVVTGS